MAKLVTALAAAAAIESFAKDRTVLSVGFPLTKDSRAPEESFWLPISGPTGSLIGYIKFEPRLFLDSTTWFAAAELRAADGDVPEIPDASPFLYPVSEAS